MGVLASAVDAFAYDTQPFLVADAIADFSAQDRGLALEYAARNCAVVTTTENVLP